jgi:hypothetical protein
MAEIGVKTGKEENVMAGKIRKAPEAEPSASALARDAGLEEALNRFPADVAAAAHAAAQARGAMPDLDDVVAEPWPPMQIRKVI